MMENWKDATDAERVEFLLQENAYFIYLCRNWMRRPGSQLQDWLDSEIYVSGHWKELYYRVFPQAPPNLFLLPNLNGGGRASMQATG